MSRTGVEFQVCPFLDGERVVVTQRDFATRLGGGIVVVVLPLRILRARSLGGRFRLVVGRRPTQHLMICIGTM
jgi:hypothetical protein